MAETNALVWDATGEKRYENGISHVALYTMLDTITPGSKTSYNKGVAWNGVTGLDASPDGGDEQELWADNIKYGSLRAVETFGGSISAYTYPDEFMECDGSAKIAEGVYIGQQTRKRFGLAYRTEEGDDAGHEYYKLHAVYNCTASPSDRSYETINDSPDAIEFSWDFDCTPVNCTGHKAVSEIVFDSRRLSAEKMKLIEETLYGSADKQPLLLDPDDLLDLVRDASAGA